jgi:hypothetical protein
VPKITFDLQLRYAIASSHHKPVRADNWAAISTSAFLASPELPENERTLQDFEFRIRLNPATGFMRAVHNMLRWSYDAGDKANRSQHGMAH